MAAKLGKSDLEYLRRFFGVADLVSAFGTDDPVEILARVNLDEIVGTGGGIVGFEEEAEQFKTIVRAAKDIEELANRHRRAGSLQYLAGKLCKSERQIRECTNRGSCPGAYQTSGGHWRIDYQNDTVQKVRLAVGENTRRRTEPRLLRLIKDYFKEGHGLFAEELVYPEKYVAAMKPGQYEYAAACRSLVLQKRPNNSHGRRQNDRSRSQNHTQKGPRY